VKRLTTAGKIRPILVVVLFRLSLAGTAKWTFLASGVDRLNLKGLSRFMPSPIKLSNRQLKQTIVDNRQITGNCSWHLCS
jgi:hypothetical protein